MTSDILKPQPGSLASQFSAMAPKSRPRRSAPPTATAPTPKTATPKTRSAKTADTPAQATQDDATSTPAPTPTLQATAPAKAPAKRAATAGERASAEGSKVRRTAFIPLELQQPVATHCASTRRNRSQMVLHALAANLQELHQLVAADIAAGGGGAAQVEEDISDVFPDLEPTRQTVPTVPLALYFTPDQIARIDSWVDHYGARDRSHLITVALRAYLSR